jgi:hypothetical protein
MHFNNNTLLNQIQNTKYATNGTAVKNIYDYNYLWHLYLHTKFKNIDKV